MRSLHPLELRKLMLEAAKPHWEAAIAAAAALGGAAISADAQDSAAKRTAGALAVPKAQPQGYSPVATAFGGKNSSASGADLAGTFSKAPLPELPKGRDAADVFRLSDALGKTDLSGQPPPIPGSAAAGGEPATMPGGFGQDLTKSAAGESLTNPPVSGESGSSWGNTLKTAQTVGQLASLARNVFGGQPAPSGGIPQAGQTAGYNPTASAAMQRLQQLLAARQGGWRGI